MQSDHLNYLVEVAKASSLNKAAVQLDLAQSTVSRGIARLEKKFGVPFLARGSGGVVLTKEGKVFLNYFQDILKDLDELDRQIEAVQLNKQFTLSICNNITFCIEPIILEVFKEMCMDHFSICVEEMSPEEVIEHMIRKRSEIGLITLTEQQEKVWEHALEVNDIVFHKITQTPIYAYVGKKSPFYNQPFIEPITLKDYTMLYLLNKPRFSLEYHMNGKMGTFFGREKVVYVEDKRLLYDFITQTEAYGIGQWWDFGADDALRLVPIKAEGFCYQIGWLQHKHVSLSQESKQFLKHFKTYVEKRLIKEE